MRRGRGLATLSDRAESLVPIVALVSQRQRRSRGLFQSTQAPAHRRAVTARDPATACAAFRLSAPPVLLPSRRCRSRSGSHHRPWDQDSRGVRQAARPPRPGAEPARRTSAQCVPHHRCAASSRLSMQGRFSSARPKAAGQPPVVAPCPAWRRSAAVSRAKAATLPHLTRRLTPRCSGRHPGELSNFLASGVDQPWLRSTARPGGAAELIGR